MLILPCPHCGVQADETELSPGGDHLMLSWLSANRDPRAFERPDEVDLDRERNPHLAFGGHGAHYCIGANLARLEVKDHGLDDLSLDGKSEKVLVKYGPEESRKLFLQLKAGENPNYPQGVEDNTHFSPLGADIMAALAVDGFREQNLGLVKFLKK